MISPPPNCNCLFGNSSFTELDYLLQCVCLCGLWWAVLARIRHNIRQIYNFVHRLWQWNWFYVNLCAYLLCVLSYLCVYGGKKQKYSPKKNAACPAEVKSQIIQNKMLCSFSNFKCDCLVLLKVTWQYFACLHFGAYQIKSMKS